MVMAETYFVWNAAMCACALPLGGRLAGLHAPGARPLLLSSVLGGLVALAALALPMLRMLGLLALPLAVFICFHASGPSACLRCLVTTLCACFVSGGAAYALMEAGVAPAASAALAIGACLLAYLLTVLVPAALCDVRQVELEAGGHSVILPAMLDSGNMLRDPVTGKSVLVIPEKAARILFPDVPDLCCLNTLPLGFRLLNVRTAAGSSLLPMFRPDACRLYLNGHAVEATLLVAVAGREYGGVQALVPMAALPSQSALLS